MKHINSLEPFSRDHGVGLFCAQQARKAVRASKTDRIALIEQIRSTCHNAILNYLEDEQWVLSPLIADDNIRTTFHERQKNIRELIDELDTLDPAQHRGLGVLSMLADALNDYVRWEEHALFPRIEEGIESEQLQQLTELATTIETNRTRPTQRLHRSVNRKPPGRKAPSWVHVLLVLGLATFVINLTMSALRIGSAEWLRTRIRTWR